MPFREAVWDFWQVTTGWGRKWPTLGVSVFVTPMYLHTRGDLAGRGQLGVHQPGW